MVFEAIKIDKSKKGKGSAIQNFIEHRIRPFGIDIWKSIKFNISHTTYDMQKKLFKIIYTHTDILFTDCK